ncbi:unnamed protein product [Tilletia laevis]|uniref:Carboxylic ester hydrolase n=1 Tax=Tilletia caries TaxID=13290 RepID=A0ABN7IVH2_9BASI|nr:unnamed protein product [Tilletia caries]CAD6938706.1 unnamed protein product [Tilletia laevis]
MVTAASNRRGLLIRAVACFLVAAVAVLPTTCSAAKAPLAPTTADLPPLQTQGSIKYRTFASNDSEAVPYNVSTFPASRGWNVTTGLGMYGWNFIWRGQARNTARPLIVFFGSSASRCDDVTDPLCILNQGVYEGWPWALRQSSNFSRGVLTDGNFAVLSIVTPYCFNKTSNSVRRNLCSQSYNTHTLKHYRPNIVIDILRQAKVTFGFDESIVVGAGQSMGARGMLRLGTSYPLKAVSVTGGNLEVKSDFFMRSLPWQNYANSFVNIYASPGDSVANLTTNVQPSCDAINNAATASGRDSALPPACQLSIQYKPKPVDLPGPTHLLLMRYGYQLQDINFLTKAIGGKEVTFPSSNTAR